MNIMMLGWELPPHNTGGLGVACYHLSKALALSGATIDFVLPYSAHHPDTEFMTIHAATPLSPIHKHGMGAYDSSQLTAGNDKTRHGHSSDRPLITIRDVQAMYADYVEHLVYVKAPEVIHAHDWLTIEAGIRAKQISGAPLIVHVHATEFDRSGQLQGNPIVHEIEYAGLMMADRIIAVSGITKRIIVEQYGIAPDKIEIVHNAIDPSSLEDFDYDGRTYAYLEHLKNEGYTVVGTLTRFTVQKGLTHLLKAAARASEKYSKLVFLLAGDGEQRDELIELASELGIADKVFFTGFVRGKQWRDAYKVIDIFVMSSVSEPFGLTALEAAHYGSALIISRQSGVGEVLQSLFRYDFWDVDVLADQLVGLAASPALLNSLRSGVKYEYAHLSWSSVAEKCISLYEKAHISNGVRPTFQRTHHTLAVLT